MNSTLAKILLLIAVITSGFVGIKLATDAPLGEPEASTPTPKLAPVAVEQPQPKQTPSTEPRTRSRDLSEQFDRSLAGKVLERLSNEKDAKIKEAQGAIEGFIQQKTNEKREQLKQIAIEALNESLSGIVPNDANLFAKEFKGISLTPEQEADIQQARQKMRSQISDLLKANPAMLQQLQADLEAGKLDRTLSEPLNNYRDAVSSALTPEQKKQWKKHFKL